MMNRDQREPGGDDSRADRREDNELNGALKRAAAHRVEAPRVELAEELREPVLEFLCENLGGIPRQATVEQLRSPATAAVSPFVVFPRRSSEAATIKLHDAGSFVGIGSQFARLGEIRTTSGQFILPDHSRSIGFSDYHTTSLPGLEFLDQNAVLVVALGSTDPEETTARPRIAILTSAGCFELLLENLDRVGRELRRWPVHDPARFDPSTRSYIYSEFSAAIQAQLEWRRTQDPERSLALWRVVRIHPEDRSFFTATAQIVEPDRYPSGEVLLEHHHFYVGRDPRLAELRVRWLSCEPARN